MANEKYINLDNLKEFKSNYDSFTDNKFARKTTVEGIEELIPNQASASNQLADKAFVNSSISTNTATYRGDYNIITDLGLTIDATNVQVIAALIIKMAQLGITPENNDYCYVKFPDPVVSTQYTKFDRYKYNGTTWLYEYTLNNSSFTAEQWAAINSGINSTTLQNLLDAASASANHIADTNNPHSVTAAQVGLGNVDNTSDANKPISTATQTALDGKLAKPSVDATSGQILGQVNNTPTWVNPPQAPVQSISIDGTQIQPDANGDVAIPNADAEVAPVVQAQVMQVDSAPTSGSTNLVESGGTYSAIAAKADLVDIAPAYDNTQTYSVGDVVTYNGDVYKCSTAVTVAEDFDSTKWTQKDVDTLIRENQPDMSNYVTLNTDQNITNKKRFQQLQIMGQYNMSPKAQLQFLDNNNSTTNGFNIYYESAELVAEGRSAGSNITFRYLGLKPYYDNYTKNDLGTASFRWHDLYLAGNLKDGTNSISIANIQPQTDANLTTTSQTVTGAINEVNSVAKGCNKAEAYADYSALITALNSASATAYVVGQSFYIQTLNVPDLWIMNVEASSVTYTYVDDATFITATGASGGVQVGYYKLAQLETLKQDLTNVVTTNTAQNITGAKTFYGGVVMKNELGNKIFFEQGTQACMSVQAGYNKTIIDDGNTNHQYLSVSSDGSPYVGTQSSSKGIRFGGKIVATTNNSYDLGSSTYKWKNLYLAGQFKDGNNASYGLVLPDTTSFTANKTIATTDQVKQLYAHHISMACDVGGIGRYSFTIINSQSTAMTFTDIAQFLLDNGFNDASTTEIYPMSGYIYANSQYNIVFGMSSLTGSNPMTIYITGGGATQTPTATSSVTITDKIQTL